MAQSLNIDACVYFPWVRLFKQSLGMPHFHIQDIRALNPKALKDAGIEGLIFDKDNTLTLPYELDIYPEFLPRVTELKKLFQDRIAILSNWAGTNDDTDHQLAETLEHRIGIPVLKHNRKKPGGIDCIHKFFNCDPSRLAMVGDRVFTDVVFGNRYGMLTFLTTEISPEGDNPAAHRSRNYELKLVEQWKQKGISAPSHPLQSKPLILV